jgi:hypothetical protein
MDDTHCGDMITTGLWEVKASFVVPPGKGAGQNSTATKTGFGRIDLA